MSVEIIRITMSMKREKFVEMRQKFGKLEIPNDIKSALSFELLAIVELVCVEESEPES